MKQASRRQYHYIYKITRIDESGRYYIGMHSTDDLEDGYFGSGKLITASVKKHGKEKHQKEILEFLPSREALKLREKELVNKELLEDKKCMNIAIGGSGGFDHVPFEVQQNGRKKGAKNFKKRFDEDPEFAKKISEANSTKSRQMLLDGRLDNFRFSLGFLNKKHTETSKAKMKISQIGNQVGEKNSQYGTMWISNLETFETFRVKNDFDVVHPFVKGKNVWKRTLSLDENLQLSIEKNDIASTESFKQKIFVKKEKELLKNTLKKQKMSILMNTVDLYNEFKSLRKVSEKLNVSHITVRGRIKEFEEITKTIILKPQGKTN